jgi:hypothetical protein
VSEIYEFDHKSPEELAAIIRPQMIGTEEHALDALTALQAQAEFPRYDALRAALADASAESDLWQVRALRAESSLATAHEREGGLRDALRLIQGLCLPGSPLWEIASTAIQVSEE